MQKIVNVHELDDGTLVCWVHPVTGKVYNFKIEYVDFNDDEQPAKLELIDNISEAEYIAVTPHIGFERKGSIRWPYASRVALSDLHDIAGSDVYMTLEDLFYPETAESTGEADVAGFTSKNKVRSVSDIKPGDVLHEPRHNAYFKVHAVQSQRALLEILNQTAQIQACPHEAIEEWFTAPGDVYWVYLDHENACDYFQTDRGINVWSTYLDEMFKVDPAELPSPAVPKIESAVLTDRELKVTLDSGEEIAVKIPKLMLPKPEELRKIRERGVNELLDTVIVDIVEQNSKGSNCLTCGDLSYAELLTIKSRLEESGYQVDLESGKISW
jgi:hypothetical protein